MRATCPTHRLLLHLVILIARVALHYVLSLRCQLLILSYVQVSTSTPYADTWDLFDKNRRLISKRSAGWCTWHLALGTIGNTLTELCRHSTYRYYVKYSDSSLSSLAHWHVVLLEPLHVSPSTSPKLSYVRHFVLPNSESHVTFEPSCTLRLSAIRVTHGDRKSECQITSRTDKLGNGSTRQVQK